jgi:hypothetical protein
MERITWKLGINGRIILKKIFLNIFDIKYNSDSLDGRSIYHIISSHTRQHTRKEQARPQWGPEPIIQMLERP